MIGPAYTIRRRIVCSRCGQSVEIPATWRLCWTCLLLPKPEPKDQERCEPKTRS